MVGEKVEVFFFVSPLATLHHLFMKKKTHTKTTRHSKKTLTDQICYCLSSLAHALEVLVE